MPSHAWNLVRATSHAAAAVRTGANPGAVRFATAVGSHDGSGAVNHPPPTRQPFVGNDASSEGGALFNPGIRSDI
uniref:Uncharacterized protein n=1 Tax=Leersia perrieri TaxID=77586 RepID=A0A0D9W694_9ORYZ